MQVLKKLLLGSIDRRMLSVYFAGDLDVILLKYDSTGSLLWARQAGSASDDAGFGVAVSGDGHVYVTGYVGASLFGLTYAGGRRYLINKSSHN